MKKLLSAMIMLALVSSVGWASVPDPDYCEVNPQDGMLCPRLVAVPLCESSFSHIDVYVRAFGGVNIDNAYVEILINGGCPEFCECDCLELTGYTDANGHVEFFVEMGGCCEMDAAACILADGVPIRQYNMIASPDVGDTPLPPNEDMCLIQLVDFTAFGLNWGLPGCFDFDGQENVSGFPCITDLPDFTLFGLVWSRGCNSAP